MWGKGEQENVMRMLELFFQISENFYIEQEIEDRGVYCKEL